MNQNRWRRNAFLGTGLAVGLLWGVSHRPSWVETAYSNGLYPWIIQFLSHLTGWFSLSLAEILIGLALAGLLFYGMWRLIQFWSGPKGRLRILGQTFADVMLMGLTVSLLGYTLWGLNYGRLSLAQRLTWSGPPREVSALMSQLRQLAIQVVELTNRAYDDCCGSTRRAAPSTSELPLSELDPLLNRGLDRAIQQLGLHSPSLGAARAKPLFTSVLMNHLGLAGFYFPWTGEANFNGDMPALEAVHSIAHEKAHQLGFAREDEASFMGFLACVRSGQPFARYSGYLFVNRQLLNLLRQADRESWKRVAARLRPEIVQDEIALRDFWRPYEGRSRQLARTVNNAHLRLNRVPGGVLSYGQSVQLLLQLAAENGNSLNFAP